MTTTPTEARDATPANTPLALKSNEGLGPLVEYADKVRALLFGLRDSDPSCTVSAWWWV